MRKKSLFAFVFVLVSFVVLVGSCTITRDQETENLRKEVEELKKEKERQNNANKGDDELQNTAPTPAKTADIPTPKPVNSGPKRIAFGKGQNWGAETITLAPGAAQQFVLRAGPGQFLEVESSAGDAVLTMITKGAGSGAVGQDGQRLSYATNRSGDFLFEVRNPTNTTLKTSIRVQID